MYRVGILAGPNTEPTKEMPPINELNLQELVNHPWMIVVSTLVATVTIVPFMRFLWKRLQAKFGEFSGQYLAITGDISRRRFLVEEVQCRQNGDQLGGTIRGVTIFDVGPVNAEIDEIIPNIGKYRFSGFVSERVFSYQTALSRVHNVGFIVLKGNDSGSLFKGQWAGVVDGEIKDEACLWVQVDPKISLSKRRDDFLTLARKSLTEFKENRRIGADVKISSSMKERELIGILRDEADVQRIVVEPGQERVITILERENFREN